MPDQTIVPEPRPAESETARVERPRRVRSGEMVSTLKYLLRTDVHTFAFSVAANSILSFFPFVVLLLTLIRRVFHSRVMYDVVVELLRDYLPAGQEFVIRNLNAMVNARQRVQVVSLIILLVTSTGVFVPLEVALNRIWRFPNNRSYLGNQLVSLGLAFACGVLALLSIGMTAGIVRPFEFLLRGHAIGLALCQAVRALPSLVTVAGWDRCDHLGPVREGDTLRSTITVEQVDYLPGGGGLVRLRSLVRADGVRADTPEPRDVLDWRFVAVMA